MTGPGWSFGRMLADRARRHPEREALVEATTGRRFTYAELDGRANRIASAIRRLGLAPGDRVGVLLHNGVEFLECYFGLATAGIVIVPLNWRLAPVELAFILDDAGAVALIHDAAFDETVDALRGQAPGVRHWFRTGGARAGSRAYEELRATGDGETPPAGAVDHDPLFIMYTSGTTGRPKGAVHTHASLLMGSIGANLTCDIRDADRELVVLPLFHIGALLPLAWTLHHGGTAVVLRAFDAALALRMLREERITTGLLVPTILHLLLEHPDYDPAGHPDLRWLIVGGAPVPAPLARRCREHGIIALQDYGSTEAAMVTIATPDDAATRPESAGRPLIHTELRIVDEHDRELPAGEVGEIVVRARHLLTEYWRRPDATAEAYRNGWFHTGDLGMVDETGRLFVRDRKNDMIISGGENIYPAEVERVLQEHPRVREVAVIGRPSEKWGESAVAVIVTATGEAVTADDIVTFCRGRLAGYKIPRVVELVDALPRTPTGKVQKHLLRQQLRAPVDA